MAEPEEIVRIAAKGDGVTADGRFVAFSAPGDRLDEDGGLMTGPHHQTPPCRHFKSCGGCDLQQLDAASYAAFVSERVQYALEGQGLEAAVIHPPQISAPHTRRRVSLRATKIGKELKLGFSGRGSHRIIDLKQCEIMHPALFANVAPLRKLLGSFGRKRQDFTVEMALVDQGVDCTIGNYQPETMQDRLALSDFAQDNGLARLSVDGGYGPETQWEPNPMTVTLGGVAVGFPHGGFLQATKDGEEALVAAVRQILGDAANVADLFAGLGTFAFAADKAQKIYAAEGARDGILALQTAANMARRAVMGEHRDLYRRPLQPAELARFDAVILDPPRAGAREQADQLAASKVPVIAYVSCNPASFARDAKRMVEGGYRIAEIWPVGQFLWSTHVELVAKLVR